MYSPDTSAIYVKFVPNDREGFLEASGSWLAAMQGKLFCKSCRRPLEKIGKIDVVVLRTRPAADFDFVMPLGLIVVHTNFLDALGESIVTEWLDVGSVTLPTGQNVDNYRTIIGKVYSQERGGIGSTMRICETCNRALYCTAGDEYLLRSAIYAPVYQTGMRSVAIIHSLFENQLKNRKWRKTKTSALPIREKPDDGFPNILEHRMHRK